MLHMLMVVHRCCFLSSSLKLGNSLQELALEPMEGEGEGGSSSASPLPPLGTTRLFLLSRLFLRMLLLTPGTSRLPVLLGAWEPSRERREAQLAVGSTGREAAETAELLLATLAPSSLLGESSCRGGASARGCVPSFWLSFFWLPSFWLASFWLAALSLWLAPLLLASLWLASLWLSFLDTSGFWLRFFWLSPWCAFAAPCPCSSSEASCWPWLPGCCACPALPWAAAARCTGSARTSRRLWAWWWCCWCLWPGTSWREPLSCDLERRTMYWCRRPSDRTLAVLLLDSLLLDEKLPRRWLLLSSEMQGATHTSGTDMLGTTPSSSCRRMECRSSASACRHIASTSSGETKRCSAKSLLWQAYCSKVKHCTDETMSPAQAMPSMP
mmetsp:Transcript_80553/g.250463  ORF Transcript_80553/g.250463 Transcript_80553/m.250463 type:complete len:384 (+) Transcript_80553:658-1809(+)